MDIVGARIEGPIGRLGCRRFHCNHPLLRCLPYKDLRLVPPQDGEAPAPRSSALSPSPASSTVGTSASRAEKQCSISFPGQFYGLQVGGECYLAARIQVAQLALKYHQNKKQQQRIIVFVGSPVKYDKKVLEMIGRKLRKNGVALDIVNFGEED